MALPPPLPPEDRTVGQLVAETIRLYARRFWAALPLGLSLAVTGQLIAGRSIWAQVALLWIAAPLLTASYVAASALALDARPTRRAVVTALVVGTLVFLPAPVLMTLFLLPALAWLALFGLAVPVAVVEGAGVRASIARARRLGTADYVHALGSLATLAIVFLLTALVLGFLLQGQGEQTARVAAFLAALVLGPLLFLGAALLYDDQAARLIRSTSPQRPPRKRRRNADVHHADDAHRPGRPDAEVEPRQAARGQP
jgi:hypothetical protein